MPSCTLCISNAVPYIPPDILPSNTGQRQENQISLAMDECVDGPSPTPPSSSSASGGMEPLTQEEVINQVATRLRIMGDQLDQEHGHIQNPEREQNIFWRALGNSFGLLVELVNIIYLEPHQHRHHFDVIDRPRPPPRRRRDTI